RSGTRVDVVREGVLMRRRSRFRASTLLLAVVLSAAPAFARGHQPSPPTEVHGLFSSCGMPWEGFSRRSPRAGTRDALAAVNHRKALPPAARSACSPQGFLAFRRIPLLCGGDGESP